jgi:hypothetical protein
MQLLYNGPHVLRDDARRPPSPPGRRPHRVCAGTPPQCSNQHRVLLPKCVHGGLEHQIGETCTHWRVQKIHKQSVVHTSSSPPWQLGQVRCARGTRSHIPVFSASQCDPACRWARATRRELCSTAPKYSAGKGTYCVALAAAGPKLQLGSVQAWRRRAAPLLPGSHGGDDTTLRA